MPCARLCASLGRSCLDSLRLCLSFGGKTLPVWLWHLEVLGRAADQVSRRTECYKQADSVSIKPPLHSLPSVSREQLCTVDSRTATHMHTRHNLCQCETCARTAWTMLHRQFSMFEFAVSYSMMLPDLPKAAPTGCHGGLNLAVQLDQMNECGRMYSTPVQSRSPEWQAYLCCACMMLMARPP